MASDDLAVPEQDKALPPRKILPANLWRRNLSNLVAQLNSRLEPEPGLVRESEWNHWDVLASVGLFAVFPALFHRLSLNLTDGDCFRYIPTQLLHVVQVR